MIRSFHALFRRLDREFRVGAIAPPTNLGHEKLIDMASDMGITVILESLLTALNERDPDRNLLQEVAKRLKNYSPLTQ
jgi:hypothetical protein